MNLIWKRKKQAIDEKKLILDYATSKKCLRSIILKRYGQKYSARCNACINCTKKSSKQDNNFCTHIWKVNTGEYSSDNAK